MSKDNEFTVSGLDILNLVVGIDERLGEVKSVSDKYEEQHPKEPEPDYKNMSLKIINRVVKNILNGWKDDLPYALVDKLKADVVENFTGKSMSIDKVNSSVSEKTGSELIKKQICSKKFDKTKPCGENNDVSRLVNDLVRGLV